MLIAVAVDHVLSLPRTSGLIARTVGVGLLAIYVLNGFAAESYNRTYMRAFDQSLLWNVVGQNVHEGDAIVASLGPGMALVYHHPELESRTRLWDERGSRDAPIPRPAWPEAADAVWIVQGNTEPPVLPVPPGWDRTFGLDDGGVVVGRYERRNPPSPEGLGPP